MSAKIDTLPGKRGQLLSLFCGAGGLDLGFEQAGYSIGAAVDIRRFSIDSYNHNRRVRVGHVSDVRRLTPKKVDDLVGVRFSPVGVIGGPPCQSFSRATHSSDDDHRHELPLEFARLLRLLNRRSPVSFFAFENVPGLLKKRHAERYEAIKSAFNRSGFEVTTALLNASWFGVAQNRPRLIVVGFNSELYPGLKWDAPAVETAEPMPVKVLLRDLPPPTFWERDLDRNSIRLHPNHWCMVPKSKRFDTPGALVPGASRWRSFRRLAWDEPSPTVAYGNREVHVHPSGNRRLSVYEALLLQGFPNTYELLGSLSDQITQVSEAVPPPLGRAIGQSISQSMELHAAAAQLSA